MIFLKYCLYINNFINIIISISCLLKNYERIYRTRRILLILRLHFWFALCNISALGVCKLDKVL
jgi:hypothetical protein